MFFTSFLFITLLLCLMPFFCVFVQTIKNLIAFAILIFLVSINLILFYSIEFFPIFFMLIYIGAIIVTTLFMVLTFDLRSEYASKKVFEKKGLFNSVLFFLCSSFFLTFLTYMERTLWKEGTLDELDRMAAYAQCVNTYGVRPGFCDTHFGKAGFDRGLYHSFAEGINDMAVISNNLYSTYSLLFILLGAILTIALLAALTLLKKGKNRK